MEWSGCRARYKYRNWQVSHGIEREWRRSPERDLGQRGLEAALSGIPVPSDRNAPIRQVRDYLNSSGALHEQGRYQEAIQQASRAIALFEASGTLSDANRNGLAGANPKPRWTLRRLVGLVPARSPARAAARPSAPPCTGSACRGRRPRSCSAAPIPRQERSSSRSCARCWPHPTRPAPAGLSRRGLHPSNRRPRLGMGGRGEHFHVASPSPGPPAKASFYGR